MSLNANIIYTEIGLLYFFFFVVYIFFSLQLTSSDRFLLTVQTLFQTVVGNSSIWNRFYYSLSLQCIHFIKIFQPLYLYFISP